MPGTAPSALVIDQGKRVLLRIDGKYFNIDQNDLRQLLGLPAGKPGVGIRINAQRFSFEFCDEDPVELTAKQMLNRLAKATTHDADR